MSKAILLVNLGSPDSPSVPDVRRYLNEFLMDGRVIDVAWPIRRFVVGMILIKRPHESGEAYEKIWTKDGSPLVTSSRNVQKLLQARLTVPVELAMRYQNPSIESAVKKLAAKGVTKTLLIPLFPHYAMSSYETAVVRVEEVARKLAPQMKIAVQPPYFDQPDYIAALVASAQDYLKDYDHLLFSYHGIPERHLAKSDPTGCHCLKVESCQSRPRDVLSRPMFRHDARVREAGGRAGGKIFRLVPVAPGQRPVAQALHRLRTRASAERRQETRARHLPGIRLRLSGNHRGDRHARLRAVHGRQRQGIHADPLHERTSGVGCRVGKDGADVFEGRLSRFDGFSFFHPAVSATLRAWKRRWF
jgi:hypothetical protein